MTVAIRLAEPDDLDDLYEICLRTGDAGGDASGVVADPRLLGHLFVAPYAVLEPELAFVAVDGEGVAGYVVGTADTRAAGAAARTVTVKIRFGEFETVTRSRTLGEPTDSTLLLVRTARDAFRAWSSPGFVPVRLVGVRLARDGGHGAGGGSLFPDPAAERQRALDRVADAVARRFGKDSIGRGRVEDGPHGRPRGQPRAGGQQSPPQSSA